MKFFLKKTISLFQNANMILHVNNSDKQIFLKQRSELACFEIFLQWVVKGDHIKELFKFKKSIIIDVVYLRLV